MLFYAPGGSRECGRPVKYIGRGRLLNPGERRVKLRGLLDLPARFAGVRGRLGSWQRDGLALSGPRAVPGAPTVNLARVARGGRPMRRKSVFGGGLVAALLLSAGVAWGALPPGGTFGDDDGTTHEGNIEAIAAAGITKGCNPGQRRVLPRRPCHSRSDGGVHRPGDGLHGRRRG
jgi:hypothetical protein